MKKVSRAARRELVSAICQRYSLSINRSCQLMSISKTGYYYKSKKHTSDGEILSYLLNLTDKYTRWGFDKMMLKVKQEQRGWNHKRVYRVYREHG